MQTRHLTIIEDDSGVAIAAFCGPWEGYPAGHGQALLQAFGGATLLTPGARQTADSRRVEFVYVLRPQDGELMLDLLDGFSAIGATPPIWSGPLADFDPDTVEAILAKAV